MRETRNNCFVSIKRNAALRQRKSDKHECLKTRAIYFCKIPTFCGTCTYSFSHGNGLCNILLTRNSHYEFLASDDINLKSSQ